MSLLDLLPALVLLALLLALPAVLLVAAWRWWCERSRR